MCCVRLNVKILFPWVFFEFICFAWMFVLLIYGFRVWIYCFFSFFCIDLLVLFVADFMWLSSIKENIVSVLLGPCSFPFFFHLKYLSFCELRLLLELIWCYSCPCFLRG